MTAINQDIISQTMDAINALDATMGGTLRPNLWSKSDNDGNVTVARIYLCRDGKWGYIQITKCDTADISRVKRQAYQDVLNALNATCITIDL